MDDGSAPADAPAAPATKRARDKKARNYSDAALAAQQAPVTSIIPTRPWTLSVLLLSALTFCVSLNLLHAESGNLSKLTGKDHIAPFQFHSSGSLATWLSGALLAWAALMSVQIYNLRRHRVDDYKGRYRVWLWTTAVLVMASIVAVSGFHYTVGGAMVRLSGKGDHTHVDLCWLAVAAAVITFVGLRMTIEMRRSMGALASLFMAMALYSVAASIKLGWIKIAPDLALQAMGSAMLFAHTFVWMTTLVYARYVYLDAQGQLVPKAPKEKKVKKPKEEAKPEDAKTTDKTVAGKQVRIDNAHTEPAKTPATPAATGGPLKGAMISNATNKSPAASNASDDRKLSKAERKRLRRQGGDDGDDE